MNRKSNFPRGQKTPTALTDGNGAFWGHLHSGVTLLLFLVFSAMAILGVFVMRDLRVSHADAQKTHAASVERLRQIAEVEHEARETRQLTLYALTTDDSNLQVEYADRTREADHHVTEGILESIQRAKTPQEKEVLERLRRDWSDYISVRNEVLASSLEGSTKEALRRDLEEGVPSFDRIDQDLGEVKRLYSQDDAQGVARAAATSSRLRTGLAVFLGLAVTFAIASILAIQEGKILNANGLCRLRLPRVAQPAGRHQFGRGQYCGRTCGGERGAASIWPGDPESKPAHD
jgi:Four helix bundle sensory module for signal transduction